MSKLLRAHFSRLWKSGIFWLCAAAMLLYAVGYMLNGCRQARITGDPYTLDEFYFQFAVAIGFFSALCGGMLFGTEYSDGTVRNKVIAGHKRSSIYLTSLVTTFTATVIFMCVWLVGAMIAVPTLGPWKMSASWLIVYLLIAVADALAYSAIFTAVFMCSSNRTVTVIVSLLLFLALSAAAGMVYNSLGEPEMVSGVQLTVDGLDMTEPVPNPNYVDGRMREVLDFVVDFLPTGQGIRLWTLEAARPVRMMISSLFMTVAATAGGILTFRRKNIR